MSAPTIGESQLVAFEQFFCDFFRVDSIADASITREGQNSIESNRDIDPVLLMLTEGPQHVSTLVDACADSGTTLKTLRRLEMLSVIRNEHGGRIADEGARAVLTDHGREAAERMITAVLSGFADALPYVDRATNALDVVRGAGTADRVDAENDAAIVRAFCKLGPKWLGDLPANPFDQKYAFAVTATMCFADTNPGITFTDLADFSGYPVQRVELVASWLNSIGLAHFEGATGGLTDDGRAMLRDYFARKTGLVNEIHAMLSLISGRVSP